MKKSIPVGILLLLSGIFTLAAIAEVPRLIGYQGEITVDGGLFDGAGDFMFAIVNSDGTVTYWTNDGVDPPAAAVSLAVDDGFYSVLLGDISLLNMKALPDSVFENQDIYLRTWFNDGTRGTKLLSPDQQIGSAGFSYRVAIADDVDYRNLVTVAKEGGDYDSIVAAFNNITDAAVDNPYLIRVMPGIYAEPSNVTLEPYVRLQGSGQGISVISGRYIIGADNATIDGFTIDSTSLLYSLYCEGNSPTVSYCTFTNSVYGAFITDASSPRLTSSTFTGASFGIRCLLNSNPLITDCTIYSPGTFAGLGLEGGASPTIRNTTISCPGSIALNCNSNSSPKIYDSSLTGLTALRIEDNGSDPLLDSCLLNGDIDNSGGSNGYRLIHCYDEDFVLIRPTAIVSQIVARDGLGNYLCDGFNDQTEINEAISFVNALGGGTVFLKEGIYSINDPISIESNISLVGTGAGTRIYLADGGDNHGIVNAGGVSGNNNIVIANLQLDGNSANNSGESCGIYFQNVDNSRIEGCWVHEWARDGILLDSDSNGNVVQRNIITGNGDVGYSGNGIAIASSYRNLVAGNILTSHITLGSSGVYLDDSSDNRIIGNQSNLNPYTGIWIYNNSDRNTIMGNICDSNDYFGILLSEGSDDNTVVGNQCNNATQSDGIRISGSNYNVVASNRCQGNTDSGAYGIRVSSSSDYCLAHGNMLEGNSDPLINYSPTSVTWDNVTD